jgi:hypothetical protein
MTQTQLATTIGAAGKAVSGSLEREALAGILEKD